MALLLVATLILPNAFAARGITHPFAKVRKDDHCLLFV
ncbi:hypothetical protein CCACVL1_22816 [Corchorus capsularis]|uniref:Uncharacterized protein n=1 Tax=Corchorus capsularis TaxID=210143 RepID=A0A1R3GWK8_COCAP|nr:hypothetical protein CCACVL1_22816 [Corchorus capsularis]